MAQNFRNALSCTAALAAKDRLFFNFSTDLWFLTEPENKTEYFRKMINALKGLPVNNPG